MIAASKSPGNGRAIRRIRGIQQHRLAALGQGNSPLIMCARAHPQGVIASHTGQTRRPGAQLRCFGDPAEEKKQPRNSSLSDRCLGKLPSPPRHEENPTCGQRCGARALAMAQSAQLQPHLRTPAGCGARCVALARNMISAAHVRFCHTVHGRNARSCDNAREQLLSGHNLPRHTHSNHSIFTRADRHLARRRGCR